MNHKVALFGEAEKGPYQTLLYFSSLEHVALNLGNPPKESLGIHLAIQTVMFGSELIFIRVKEEGYSIGDYYKGFDLLKEGNIPSLSAICIPGVGDANLIDFAYEICEKKQTVLMTTEKDFYDYLTTLQVS